MVNHGIPVEDMEEMIEGIKQFQEQPSEVKMAWYSRDVKQQVRFYCNGDLFIAKAANWRDSIACNYDNGVLDSDALPLVCRYCICILNFFFRSPLLLKLLVMIQYAEKQSAITWKP